MLPEQEALVIGGIFIAGDQVHVKMKHGLTGNLAIILQNIKPVAAKRPRHGTGHFPGQGKEPGGKGIVQFIDISIMLLGENQRMSLAGRIGV